MMLKISFSMHVHVYRKGTPEVKDEGENEEIPVQSTSKCFFVYAEEEIAQARERHQHSTADNYTTALRSFAKYYDGKQLPLSDIDSHLIEEYGRWLQGQVNKNTLSCYMRSLRSIYNKAVECNLVVQSNPFRNVFTGIARTRKRSIGIADICKLREVDLEPGSFMQLVRDIFLFCFYACGMPFIDVAFFKKTQIKDGSFSYYRRKTNQFVQIKIEPCIAEIIERYKSDTRDYVFPFLTSSDVDSAYKEYQRKFSSFNKTLNELGEKAGVGMRLSSYVARHTWATLAFHSMVDMPVISQALGHTNMKTTQIYVKDIGNDKQNAANRKILKGVLESAPLYKS